MRKTVYAIVLSIVSFVFSGCSSAHYKKACFNTGCIKVELAVSPEERTIGLMYRDKLEYIGGMLFVFNDGDVPSFWMKNVRFPLDIIWFDRHKRILHIDENVLVCSDDCPGLSFDGPVRYVLEVPAGFSKEKGLKIGDILKF